MQTAKKDLDPRLVDIIISVAAFAVFLLLIAILPSLINEGIAYLTAIIIFVAGMSAAGLLINRWAGQAERVK